MKSEFKKAIESNKFLVTCELAPPKGDDFSSLIENAKPLKNLVNAINITDGQGGNMRMSSVVASYLMQRDAGVEAICQLVCRDRNRIGLQSDILGASALGLKNYLALSGDKAKYGDHPNAQDVFDLGTDDLVQAFGNFAKGLDLNENKINSEINDLCVGAASHPGVPDLEAQAQKMKARENAGVNFFQTQIVYESEQLKRFLDSVIPINSPVLIGITPLKSVKMANFMNEKVYGVTVPQSTIDRLEKSADPQAEGIEMAIELITEVKRLSGKGVHIMAIGQEKKLPEIIQKINSVAAV